MEASALILAAGAGTRMKSAKPKVVHEILKKPLVRWVIDAAHAAGIDAITTVVGNGRDQVEPLVADTNIVVQEDQLGTAHAVKSAREALGYGAGSVVVLTGDSPLIRPSTIKHLLELQQQQDAAVVVLTMQVEDPFGYGRIVRDADDAVCAIVEHKDCSDDQLLITECNSGFYCFDKEFLFDALDRVSTENAQGEYYLTDVLGLAYEAGKTVVALVTEEPSECLGVNSRKQLAEATACLQARINDHHMANGVTIMDPNTTWIGPDATIAPDTEILPMSFLFGATQVGSGCIIGPNSRLEDTIVGNGCTLEETIALSSRIDDGATCGPRAYLRPETHLCEGAKAGTHVEIKKSTIGKDSKVPHLSYVGDATIGVDVNLGAGTITCNYDGEKKWPTTIGDRAFVGSDVMLVAPVNIGADALIGAGSVITKDVSEGALGLGRARQTEIEGWNKKNKTGE